MDDLTHTTNEDLAHPAFSGCSKGYSKRKSSLRLKVDRGSTTPALHWPRYEHVAAPGTSGILSHKVWIFPRDQSSMIRFKNSFRSDEGAEACLLSLCSGRELGESLFKSKASILGTMSTL